MGRNSVRQVIVEAGLKLFLERGFNASSVQDITAAAGVPKGSFYNHFASKEILGAEIVRLYGERNASTLLGDRSLPALERLRRYFVGLNSLYIGMDCQGGCLLGNFSAELAEHSELIRTELATLLKRWTGEIEATIQEAQAQGAVSMEFAPSELAAFLLDAYQGSILRARIEQGRGAFDRFVNLAFNKILR